MIVSHKEHFKLDLWLSLLHCKQLVHHSVNYFYSNGSAPLEKLHGSILKGEAENSPE